MEIKRGIRYLCLCGNEYVMSLDYVPRGSFTFEIPDRLCMSCNRIMRREILKVPKVETDE